MASQGARAGHRWYFRSRFVRSARYTLQSPKTFIRSLWRELAATLPSKKSYAYQFLHPVFLQVGTCGSWTREVYYLYNFYCKSTLRWRWWWWCGKTHTHFSSCTSAPPSPSFVAKAWKLANFVVQIVAIPKSRACHQWLIKCCYRHSFIQTLC